MSQEVLKMALDWAEAHGEIVFASGGMSAVNKMNSWVAAIKEALAQLEQPHRAGFWCVDLTCSNCYSSDFRFKHTTPPQRTWVGIPEQDLKQGDESFFVAWREGARCAEAKLKKKNGFAEEKNT